MSVSSRPLSPHLQVYRLPLTAILSICHRASGAMLSLGAIVLTALLVSAAIGESQYASLHALISSLPGQIVLWGFVYALYFHLCTGVRHLVWDTGRGLDLKSVDWSSAAVLVISVLLTIATFVVAAIKGGAV